MSDQDRFKYKSRSGLSHPLKHDGTPDKRCTDAYGETKAQQDKYDKKDKK